jgi:hypothetical protein
VNVIGVSPVHVPFDAVNASPCCEVPLMLGGPVLVGGTGGAGA